MPPTIHETVRSRRRTLALQITEEGRLVVRAPRHVSDSEIRRFVREKSAWIDRMAARAAERARTAPPPLSPEEEKSLKVLARDAFIERACRYAARMGVTFRRIRLMSAKTRWGSCGPGGNLSFNWRLIRAPLDVLDYVVVHELAHLVEPNHSPRFWSKVAEYCPAFRDAKLWLRRNRL
ncbi:MAG TPA: SprT family zinc-dependent metalloprotease [Candidatus Eisenbacteria bacterium]|nr:SprT family zinc-dependent metalloprotease [Candidatus Eisenbacteria bacterium]